MIITALPGCVTAYCKRYDCPTCAGAGVKSALKVKVQDGPELYVCRLQEGRQDFANLDLVLDEYTEFTVEGAALHITGSDKVLHHAFVWQCMLSGKQLSSMYCCIYWRCPLHLCVQPLQQL